MIEDQDIVHILVAVSELKKVQEIGYTTDIILSNNLSIVQCIYVQIINIVCQVMFKDQV